MTKIITSKFKPRPYQRDLFDAFIFGGYKRFIRVMHRRAGKDHEAWALCFYAALMRKGLYLYLLPTIGQANTVIWEGRGKTGVGFLDYIPKKLIKRVNQSKMSITLANGSIIRVTGSNNYTALIGSNPLGIVYSEFQDADPKSLEYMRPILAENGGWVLINGTPRGRHNNLFQVYNQNAENPDWFITVKPASETTDWDGSAIITQSIIDEEIRAGMPPELVEQEFNCSWDGFVEGAYFTRELKDMRKQGAISCFPVDPELPVYTSWDIGSNDANSICLWQIGRDNSIRCIYCFEENYKNAEWYANELKNIQRRLGFKKFAMHFLPHDVAVQEWGSGRTRIEQLASAGILPKKVQRLAVSERIQCLRSLLPRMKIHSKNAKTLELALSDYHSKKNSEGVTIGPAHNWASHSVDAASYFAVGYLDRYDRPNLQRQKHYAKINPFTKSA